MSTARFRTACSFRPSDHICFTQKHITAVHRWCLHAMSPAKDGSDEEHLAFLAAAQSTPGDDDVPPPRRHAWKPVRHLRLIIECAMAVALVVLLVRPPSFSCRASGRRSPVPECEFYPLCFFEEQRTDHSQSRGRYTPSPQTNDTWTRTCSRAISPLCTHCTIGSR